MDLAQRYRRVRLGLALKDKDPLAYFHFGVPRLREAFAMLVGPDRIEELHLRACNKGGKTLQKAAYVLGCLQKRAQLDGVPLPQWRGPVEALCGVLDYKQQLLSVQPAYLKLLGTWPHHPRYRGEILTSLRVQPLGGGSDESEWSVIHFLSQENRATGVGARADIVDFDEPPRIEILRELRKASHAGRPSIRLIGETPTIRRQWAPLKEDYGDIPRSSLRRIDPERAEVRWSLPEVADWVLSQAEKDRLLRIYLGPGLDWDHPRDPLALARIHGDYIDASGLCPFHIPTLRLMLEECSDPEVWDWRITQEADDSGRTRISRMVPVEVWQNARHDRTYLVTIDPSSGVADTLHDPYEIEVTEMGSGDLVARAGGYLGGYMVGLLAAGIARQYGNAAIDVEMNDRWGANVVEGVRAAQYGHFAYERRDLGNGEWASEVGFHNTGKTRPRIIGAVQAWVDAWAAGVKYARCPSRFVINQLLDCILDERGRIVAAPGLHDEALIVRGQALRRAVQRQGRDIPDGEAPRPTREQTLIEEIMGTRDAEAVGPVGVPILTAGRRPS